MYRVILFGIFMLFIVACSNEGEASSVTTYDASKERVFEKRFIYFDRSFAEDENFYRLKKLIVDAKKLGFNGLVWSEEYIFSRLSHQNPTMNKLKIRFREIADLARKNKIELIPMHFNPSIPTFVTKDSDPNNPFYQNGKFDFAEANRVDTTFIVDKNEARIKPYKHSLTSPKFLDKMFYFDGIKPNREYKLTVTLTTKNFQKGYLKVSVLDSFDSGSSEILFGVNQYFRNIKPTSINRKYQVYFNSLNHENLNGKIKVYLPYDDEDGVKFSKLEIEEVGLVSSLMPKRKNTTTIVKSKKSGKVFQEGKDYTIGEEKLNLLSDEIKKERELLVSWYPLINVARIHSQETMADFCANPKLYIDIIKDQYRRLYDLFGGVDGIAFNNDEWREAGFDEDCKKIFQKEYAKFNKSGKFTGGDYIGITTRRIIEEGINFDTKKPVYLMSDMFDPNFNARNPYMGVNRGGEGSWEYLPKEAVVFNWFVNPEEPGLEDVPYSSFLKSLKHFSDHNISQIIAGYHDDMKNVETNIKVYKDSDEKTRKSIIGFMFLIWHQGGEKRASYGDMPKVVKQICKDLPGKWPEDICKNIK